ncbi:hypothetical protein F1737_05220 [Methanoplanus sp. FWC-SCC4]|uniref:DUF3566 domain-containing protein n=1 Tax=Methanochimaera problematica TaxID=2609417 RepID=A0AA97FDP7_9EURY|nr:hypothetical protein [Methanoplanus sp. FWC-SCC4]WOF16148.1 hypothetical protein F1737_05220 [Methanoplanus sp. FWC-SCC4]
MPEITYIDVISAAIVTGTIFLIFGFIVALITTILGLFAIVIAPLSDYSYLKAGSDLVGGLVNIIITSLGLGFGGFVLGATFSLLYNFTAEIFGGIYVDLVEYEYLPEKEETEETPIGYE